MACEKQTNNLNDHLNEAVVDRSLKSSQKIIIKTLEEILSHELLQKERIHTVAANVKYNIIRVSINSYAKQLIKEWGQKQPINDFV